MDTQKQKGKGRRVMARISAAGLVGAALVLCTSAALWGAEGLATCLQCDGKGKIEKICRKCRTGKVACAFCRGKDSPDWANRSEEDLAISSPGDGTIVCQKCRGNGVVAGMADGVVKCSTCGGARKFRCPKCEKGRVPCPDCKGNYKTEVDCPRCNGSGKIASSGRGGSELVSGRDPAPVDSAPLSLEARRLKIQLEIVQLQEAIENLKKRLAEVEAEIAKSKADGDSKKPAPEAEHKKPADKGDDF